MKKDYALKPAISIDLKRDRIRIHKTALRTIGDPEYILLLVNPEERTLAILRSDRSDLRAHRLPRVRFNDKQCFEITSKPLVRSLLNLCNEWHDNRLYRIYGESIPTEGVVQFNLAESIVACETQCKI